MNTAPKALNITRLEFKNEGENDEGLPIGKLTDQNADPVFADGRWVTKKEALQLAKKLDLELDEY